MTAAGHDRAGVFISTLHRALFPLSKLTRLIQPFQNPQITRTSKHNMAGKISFWRRHGTSSQTATTTVPAPRTDTVTITVPAAVTYRVRLSTENPQPKSVQVIPGITTIGELKKSIAKEFKIPAVRLRQNLVENDIVTKHIDHRKGPLIVDVVTPRPESPPAYDSKLDDEPPSTQTAPSLSSPATPAAEASLSRPGEYEYNVYSNEAIEQLDCQRNIISRAAPKNARTFTAHVNQNRATAGKQDNFNLDAESLMVLVNAGIFSKEEARAAFVPAGQVA
ncbi:hypothetical protein QBC41DRAFT_309215 [Cercophora samala]|uniref:Uncharacterized protein n=1 Tax=Cercophora samala TaxID=330535 RepID=A0AA39ZP61_9PEZI|nr:hypothetical protein QBC41DRAFT_309215 [Cercophora samala]